MQGFLDVHGTSIDSSVMASPLEELTDVLSEVETLLKNADVEAALAAKGVNTSLAMVALDGLRAYVNGDKARAAEELGTFAEEVAGRLALASGKQPN
jgi:hypothetical protein